MISTVDPLGDAVTRNGSAPETSGIADASTVQLAVSLLTPYFAGFTKLVSAVTSQVRVYVPAWTKPRLYEGDPVKTTAGVG